MTNLPAAAILAIFIVIIMSHLRSCRSCFLSPVRLHQQRRQQFHSKGKLRVKVQQQSLHGTQYTIDCPPTDPETLRRIVQKHSTQLDLWLKNKPIAEHTRRAFDMLDLSNHHQNTKIILDSGCGTGRSSVLLANKYPDHLVIGIDQSLVRLNRNVLYRKQSPLVINDNDNYNDDDNNEPLVQRIPDRPNLRLVRAELSDFWRCCLEAQLPISRQYILYPNPYPKKARVKSRWYAHPSFPLIFHLGGDAIIVKSNWNLYLQEFCQSVEYMQQDDAVLPYLASARKGPVERTDKSVAWTNFEKKYDDCGEQTYELVLEKSPPTLR